MLSNSDLNKIREVVREVAVTKEDAERFVTKEDIIGLARGTELDELKITFHDNLIKWKNELFTKVDKILQRLDIAENENVIYKAHEKSVQELEERLDNHEDRNRKLEHSIHI